MKVYKDYKCDNQACIRFNKIIELYLDMLDYPNCENCKTPLRIIYSGKQKFRLNGNGFYREGNSL